MFDINLPINYNVTKIIENATNVDFEYVWVSFRFWFYLFYFCFSFGIVLFWFLFFSEQHCNISNHAPSTILNDQQKCMCNIFWCCSFWCVCVYVYWYAVFCCFLRYYNENWNVMVAVVENWICFEWWCIIWWIRWVLCTVLSSILFFFSFGFCFMLCVFVYSGLFYLSLLLLWFFIIYVCVYVN